MIERDLVDVPVYLGEEFPRLLADFTRRLDEIASYANGLGALLVLIAPPGNDADFEPNRSFLPADTPRHERESFRRAFLETRLMEDTDPTQSMKRYRELLTRQPGFAETHYRLATLYRKAGLWADAYRHFIAARDADGYPMRCLTSFQQVYRDVASRHDCLYIDGQSYFHAIGRNGLLDDELFQDAMHPSLRGQIALAQAVVHAIEARRACNWPADLPPPAIDPTECAEHFGMDNSAWEHAARWSRGFYSLVGRLRYDSSERSRRIDEAGRAGDRIEGGSPPEAVGLVNVGIPTAVPLVSELGRGARALDD
jgi:lysophospholipase L1-like esterase